jgi:predicted metalloenzyme YecM
MNIFNSVEEFLEKVFENLENDGIDVADLELDHLCYRVETMQEYDELKKELENVGKMLGEIKVKQRFIATYKLDEPIIFKGRKISVVEVPQPSEHASYKKGWQHGEFVIGDEFEDFINKYSEIKFVMSGNKDDVNPELKLVWSDDCAVKFHHHSLEYVVTVLEK